ncbi:MAG TPA: phosphatase PAP2 family protein [Bacillales bacterium]|nr:phosphatase PAP2 family protein [Bacillales bacterium]
MDTEVFRIINDLAGQISWLDTAMAQISKYAVYASILAVLLLFIKDRKAAFAGVVGIVVGMVLDVLIQLVYSRPHPFMAMDNIQLLAEKEMSASFPSDTAMMAFAAAMAICLASRKWGWLSFLAAGIIAISRVYVGFHFPGDVLAGAVIGLAVTGGIYGLLPTRKTPWSTQKHFPM